MGGFPSRSPELRHTASPSSATSPPFTARSAPLPTSVRETSRRRHHSSAPTAIARLRTALTRRAAVDHGARFRAQLRPTLKQVWHKKLPRRKRCVSSSFSPCLRLPPHPSPLKPRRAYSIAAPGRRKSAASGVAVVSLTLLHGEGQVRSPSPCASSHLSSSEVTPIPSPPAVIPAKAGITAASGHPRTQPWIPAFAGMTGVKAPQCMSLLCFLWLAPISSVSVLPKPRRIYPPPPACSVPTKCGRWRWITLVAGALGSLPATVRRRPTARLVPTSSSRRTRARISITHSPTNAHALPAGRHGTGSPRCHARGRCRRFRRHCQVEPRAARQIAGIDDSRRSELTFGARPLARGCRRRRRRRGRARAAGRTRWLAGGIGISSTRTTSRPVSTIPTQLLSPARRSAHR